MSITIIQQPLDLTPSNAQHIYNVSSTLSGQTDFRYVFDVWINPYTTNKERVARLKVAPNTAGNGIVDVGDIVRNYAYGNPRSSNKQNVNGSNTSTITTPNGIITNTEPTAYILSNAFNNNSVYETLPHVIEYRVLVGEQYSSGGTITTSICTNPSLPPSIFLVYTTDEGVAYSGSPNTIEIEDAGSSIPTYNNTGLVQGSTILHTTSAGTYVYSAYTTNTALTYTPASAPSNGDLLVITENYSGINYVYRWNCSVCELSGWNLFTSYNGGNCMTNPPPITIWPGTQENKTNFNYNNNYWSGNTNGQNNQLFYEGFKFAFTGYTNISATLPAQFLSTFGNDLYTSTFLGTGSTTFTDSRVRRRQHHYECPLLVSHFWTNNGSFNNYSTAQVPYEYSVDKNTPYTNKITLSGITYSANTLSPDYRIVYSTPPFSAMTSGGKLATWRSSGTGTQIFSNQYRISEIVEYHFYGADCMSDPQHYLFLNSQGVWDTYTFDRKNIKTFNKDTNTYAQGSMRDNSVFNPFFYDKRAVIYDQYTTESVEAQSNYIDENERKIVEEMFLSTDVYLIQQQYYNGDGSTNYSKTPYLIPIVITSKSMDEYKQRYNKLFQYTISYEYNPNQLFRTTL